MTETPEEHTMTTTYTAWIMNDDGDHFGAVDLRTIDADRLRLLRDEAGCAGDSEMVSTIDSILAGTADAEATR